MNLEKMHTILNAREERSRMQQQLLNDGGILISYSLNIPGPVKNSALYRFVFEKGERQIDECLEQAGLKAKKKILSSEAGDCGLWLLEPDEYSGRVSGPDDGGAAELRKESEAEQEPAYRVKQEMVHIEETDDLGRLMDIDVLYLPPDMQYPEKVSRTQLGKDRRTCLVCGQPVFNCIRSARHQVPEVMMEVVDRILEDEEIQNRILGICPDDKTGCDTNAGAEETAKKLALEALRSLLYEVIISPKPGLVDAENSGAHQDMDITTFFDSALAITPYFKQCFDAGRENAECAPEKLLPGLRPLGIHAEQEMYLASHGTNTHKGAVFNMGVMLVACGMLYGQAERRTAFEACSDTEKNSVFPLRFYAEQILDLAGRILSVIDNGSAGLRKEVLQGYPTLKRQALPVLRSFRNITEKDESSPNCEAAGKGAPKAMEPAKKDLNAAGVRALLAMMSELDDANIIRRAGREKLEEMKKRITGILDKNRNDAQLLQEAEDLDAWLIRENISPGGSADLLECALFLTALEMMGTSAGGEIRNEGEAPSISIPETRSSK